MFGCGLPVCAVDFECIRELVEDGVNGKIFDDAGSLATLLLQLLAGLLDHKTWEREEFADRKP